MEERLFTVHDVSAMLRISTASVYRYVRLGKLQAVRVAGIRDLRFSRTAIDALLEPVEPGGRE